MANALQFNASGEGATRATGPDPNSAYTAVFWLRVDTNRNTDYQNILAWLMGGGNAWEQLILDSSNRLALAIGVGGTETRATGGSAFGTGTWRHIAIVRSSTTDVKVYVDGTQTLSLTTNVSTRSNTQNEFAFSNEQFSEYCYCSVAYARAWTVALTTTEIAAEKNAEAAIKTASLWADWPFQADDDDDTANARHFTTTGSVAYVTTGPTLPLIVAPAAAAAAATAISPTVSGGGGVTVTPDAAAVAATAINPTVIAGSAVTVTPDPASATASAVAPTVVAGAITITPAAAAATTSARFVLLAEACTAGILHVDTANPRYFANRNGIVFLAGFHTWETLVDHGDSDPPDVFDYDAFLDALVADGCTFIKIWACESLRDWCDAVKYFDPVIYQRTGPGNANDGKLKVDLTQFNQAYFDRLRERVIEAGNRGIYACVQLFQGWQAEQKGYSTGAPGTYHPYNGPNNINGIDGDTDNDGDMQETRSTTWAGYSYQLAYVEKVLDTLNDLDHVIYEISNEDTSGSVAWQHAIIDHVHDYEAGLPKQHPVGMTVIYPGGSNTDLYNSNAEWISPNDSSIYTNPPTSDGSKVICYDTDHVDGLTETHQWIFRTMCRGNYPWFMDPWDGDFYGIDMRTDPEHVRIRNMLGYAVSYANRIDLANATPQSSRSSTNYCLAKTTGIAQILAYQSASGAFTVDLADLTGTWTVEWLRTSTGATQAGSNVSGGAVRTLTPPWSGEDAVAFLERAADSMTPAAAAAAATATSPTVVIGGISVAPEHAAAVATAIAPSVVYGALVISPATAGSAATAGDPLVILGAVAVAPAAASTTATAIAPAIVLGATTATPDPAATGATAISPAVVYGAITLTPDAATATAAAISPTVDAGGALSLTPDAAAVAATAVDPAVMLGATTATPQPASAAATATNPTVQEGGISVAPEHAAAVATAVDPLVILGALVIVADAATSTATAIAPTVVYGATSVTPQPAAATAGAASPVVIIGVIVAAVTLTARRNFTLSARRTFTLHYRR